MPKFFVNSNQINGDKITIKGKDVNHIINVLRMKKDDHIEICDLNSNINYLSSISEYNKDRIICKIEEEIKNNNETNIDITLFQGIPKFDKMELIIQKNTEIGIKEIVPVKMTRCIAKIKDSNKIERWNKIAEIAAKQSMRNLIPVVKNQISIEELCESLSIYDIVFLAYEKEKNNTLKQELKKINIDKNKEYRIGIIIGPEGGITEQEIEKFSAYSNVKVITLGNRILRTETAGLVLSSNIIYELED